MRSEVQATTANRDYYLRITVPTNSEGRSVLDRTLVALGTSGLYYSVLDDPAICDALSVLLRGRLPSPSGSLDGGGGGGDPGITTSGRRSVPTLHNLPNYQMPIRKSPPLSPTSVEERTELEVSGGSVPLYSTLVRRGERRLPTTDILVSGNCPAILPSRMYADYVEWCKEGDLSTVRFDYFYLHCGFQVSARIADFGRYAVLLLPQSPVGGERTPQIPEGRDPPGSTSGGRTTPGKRSSNGNSTTSTLGLEPQNGDGE